MTSKYKMHDSQVYNWNEIYTKEIHITKMHVHVYQTQKNVIDRLIIYLFVFNSIEN